MRSSPTDQVPPERRGPICFTELSVVSLVLGATAVSGLMWLVIWAVL